MAKSGQARKNNVPLYQMVREHILDLINDSDFEKGGLLPSENKLVEQLKVSRMTVNRALRELVIDGHVERIAGVGTFALEKKASSHPLEIHSIAQEIELRGHVHASKVVELNEVRASVEDALYFSIRPGARLFHSVILHSESDMPLQVEERLILPQFAPEYLGVDFSEITPTDYLMSISSKIEEIEQIVQADIPQKDIRELLVMKEGEPCLVLLRRTWLGGRVVTRTVMHYPSGRFQFGSRYTPK